MASTPLATGRSGNLGNAHGWCTVTAHIHQATVLLILHALLSVMSLCTALAILCLFCDFAALAVKELLLNKKLDSYTPRERLYAKVECSCPILQLC